MSQFRENLQTDGRKDGQSYKSYKSSQINKYRSTFKCRLGLSQFIHLTVDIVPQVSLLPNFLYGIDNMLFRI